MRLLLKTEAAIGLKVCLFANEFSQQFNDSGDNHTGLTRRFFPSF